VTDVNSWPDPYSHSWIDGKPLDYASIYAIRSAEEVLGYRLTVLQGIGGAVASAGAHLLGRCVDFSPWDADRKLHVLKDVGFDIWHRPYVAGLWPEHLHGALVLNRLDNTRGIAPVGFRQIASFQARRDGLVSNLPDLSYRPTPPAIFIYPPKKEPAVPDTTPVTQARDALVRAMHELDKAANLLDSTDPGRVKAHAEVDDLQHLKRETRNVLEALPKR
jgi:hypothetical protein